MTSETLQQTSVETERRGRIPILISGLPGRMATLVAEAVEQHRDFELLPLAMTSVNHHQEVRQFGERRITLVTAQEPFHRRINHLPGRTIAVDFSRTNSVVENARNYVASNIPFVMGTSVGDHGDEIETLVRNSQVSAVIAPNMDIEVVTRQMAIDDFAQSHPGIFEGAEVVITESHQATKVDREGRPIVSGTALAFQAQFEGYGARLRGEIESIRDPERQRELGVPEEFLGGHGYHFVTAYGPTGRVVYQFETRVDGRGSYVEGALGEIRFLAEQMRNGSRGEVFTPRDVIAHARRQA